MSDKILLSGAMAVHGMAIMLALERMRGLVGDGEVTAGRGFLLIEEALGDTDRMCPQKNFNNRMPFATSTLSA
jgi:hypothetical protein